MLAASAPMLAGLGVTSPDTSMINAITINAHVTHRIGAIARKYHSIAPLCL